MVIFKVRESLNADVTVRPLCARLLYSHDLWFFGEVVENVDCEQLYESVRNREQQKALVVAAKPVVVFRRKMGNEL